MLAVLNCAYERGLIPAIESFVSGCADAAGASSEERRAFELAAEEIAAHIVDSYLPQEESESFSVECRALENGLEFVFEDKGLPIDADKALRYDAESPLDTLEGLRFHIVRSVCDSFELSNKGKDGWSLKFSKTIKDFRPVVRLRRPEEAGTEEKPARPKEKLEFVKGSKADIPALIELTYYAFRYTNEPEFYTKEGLESLMAKPYHVFNLVKTETGKVVASQDYFIDPEKSVDVVHYGTLMTHPDYRESSAALKVFKALKAVIDDPPHPDAKFWFQYIVTSHTGSQRFAEMCGATTCALDLSRDRMMNFSGDLKSSGQRESFLLSWVWLKRYHGSFSAKICCPQELSEIVKKIFSWQKIALETDCSSKEAPSSVENNSLELCDYDRYAIIHVESFPETREEFGKALRRRKDEACSKGAETVCAYISTKNPLPGYLLAALREHGFFFTGIYPCSASDFKLHFTCLGGQSFDFAKLQIYAESARELFEFSKAEFAKL